MSELSNKERVLKIAIALEELNATRGGMDYRGSKDFEDIVYIVDSCHNLTEEIARADEEEVMEYLKSEFLNLCQRPNIREEVECALTDTDRVDYVMEIIRSI